MTAGRVDQVSVGDALRDHDERIRALEATPSAAETIYENDQLLTVDTPTITFDGLPANLSVLELEYSACTLEGLAADIGVGTILFTDPPEPSADWLWNLNVPNPIGAQGQLTDGSFTNAIGAFAFIPPFATANLWAVGSIKFPNYTIAEGDAESYVGYGTAPLGSDTTPDVWTVGGHRQSPGPITKIVLTVYGITDTGLTTPLTFKTGSRFTLLGI